ncbi:TonB family protein [Mucilaginibacter sp.]|uniref:TonB family protein n=1 Tax=Mucilaginibacter sp. TaxID=1882438 RepID=UPI0035BC6463
MIWWNYLLLVNIYLVLFFGFYALLLRRETFFQLNRIYLVGSALLSFIIPLIQAQWVKELFITRQVQETIYSATTPDMLVAFAPLKDNPVTVGEIITLLYAAGIVMLSIRLVWQLFEVKKLISQPSKGAYSFFKSVKIQDDVATNEVITRHEEVHVRQWHSADVLIIEAIMIVNWFNPVVYLYRFAVKHIHEFIADRQALAAGTDKADYALLLLSQTFNSPVHSLVNPFFNHSLLKQRIMMLQKNKSQRIKLAKYGLSAPLFILMLILSSATISNSKAVITINYHAEEVFLKPAASVVAAHKIVEENLSRETTNIKTTVVTLPPLVNAVNVNDTGSYQKQVFTAVEHAPTFVGGDKALGEFLAKNIHYPKEAREKNIQGRVIATFVVEPNGALTNVQVLRGIGYGADEETIRVLKMSPKWKPGVQNRRKVRVQYSIPVKFSLSTDDVAVIKPQGKNPPPPPAPAVVQSSGKKNTVLSAFEQSPQFPGGDHEFVMYLAKNIRYPKKARENNTQGRVIVSFIVETDGSLTNLKVVRGVGDGTDEEAVRVLKASPKWIAGTQNGQKVRVNYVVPINFALARDNKMGAIKSQQSDNIKQQVTQNSIIKESSASNDLAINNPLYIVDGKEISDLSTISPNDIKSVSVLKDRNSVEKYGAKGINGVVIVDLKKSKVK